MKDVVNNANTNAAKVQGALSKLAADLSTSGAKMSAVVVQNGQP